jgi:hypothetical protein
MNAGLTTRGVDSDQQATDSGPTDAAPRPLVSLALLEQGQVI